jgi:antitoxin component of MazEF toxin-antitoxin module
MKKYRSTEQTANPVRKLSKVGKYSYAVTIPKDLIKKLGWKERQKLVVKLSGRGLNIKDWQSK